MGRPSWTSVRTFELLMDIDDILDTLNDPSGIPQETKDLQELTRLWVIERSAPEILRWPEALMDRVLDRIRKQVKTTLNPQHRLTHGLLLQIEPIAEYRLRACRLRSSRTRPAARIRKRTSVSSSSRLSSSDSNTSSVLFCGLGLPRYDILLFTGCIRQIYASCPIWTDYGNVRCI